VVTILALIEDWNSSTSGWSGQSSFTIILAAEIAEWKPFRNALDKKERSFDDLFDVPKLYITACSNSVQLVPLHPIVMSILFHHYK
jgi:hypothetical protein